jgi:hypothetical protein
MTPEAITLTELQYSTNTSGPLRLYLYRADGYHTGGIWFHRDPKYPDAQINIQTARLLVERHIRAGREVTITNSGDNCVYRASQGKVLYPADPDAFWREASAI